MTIDDELLCRRIPRHAVEVRQRGPVGRDQMSVNIEMNFHGWNRLH